MLFFPLLCYFLSFLLLLGTSSVSAFFFNITVDDSHPDPLTGAAIMYAPADVWNAGGSCSGCTARPNPTQAYNNSWHDGTFNPLPGSNFEPNTPLNITFQFQGSALYVYCILAHTSTNPDGKSDMSFYLNGEPVGTFIQAPNESPNYDFNVPVYANPSIPYGLHTFTLQNGHINGSKSLVLFDYFVYTHQDNANQPFPDSPSLSIDTSVPDLPSTFIISSTSTTETGGSTSPSATQTTISGGGFTTQTLSAFSTDLSTSDTTGATSAAESNVSNSLSPAPTTVHSAASSSPSSSSGRMQNIIIGASVGGGALLLALVALLFFCWRRKRYNSYAPPPDVFTITASEDPSMSGWAEGTWPKPEEPLHPSLAPSSGHKSEKGELRTFTRRIRGRTRLNTPSETASTSSHSQWSQPSVDYSDRSMSVAHSRSESITAILRPPGSAHGRVRSPGSAGGRIGSPSYASMNPKSPATSSFMSPGPLNIVEQDGHGHRSNELETEVISPPYSSTALSPALSAYLPQSSHSLTHQLSHVDSVSTVRFAPNRHPDILQPLERGPGASTKGVKNVTFLSEDLDKDSPPSYEATRR